MAASSPGSIGAAPRTFTMHSVEGFDSVYHMKDGRFVEPAEAAH